MSADEVNLLVLSTSTTVYSELTQTSNAVEFH